MSNRILFSVGFGLALVAASPLGITTGLPSQANDTQVGESSTASQLENGKDDNLEKSVLRHVVLFQFKDSSSSQDILEVVKAFQALPQAIPEVSDFEFGTNNSPEGLNEDLTHCFLLTFQTEKDRDVYLKHSAHQAFVALVTKHLQKAVVVDYWTGR